MSYTEEDLEKAFEAGRRTRTVRTQGNWNRDDFSDYEEHEVKSYKDFEEYLKEIQK